MENIKSKIVGLIPTSWQVASIGEACLEFVNGGTPSTKNAEYWKGSIPWITGADFLDSFHIGIVRRYITMNALNNSSSHLIPKGNILLVTRTGVGKIAIAPFNVAISQDITGLILRKDIFDVDFIYYCLQTLAEDFKKFNQGTSINGIIRKDLERKIVPRPSLGEQTIIASILRSVDKVIEKTEAAIEKYKAIKAGMMQDLFTRGIDTRSGKLRPTIEEVPELYKESKLGWIPKDREVTEFKSACLEFINGGTPSTKNASNWVGTIPWITGADFLESFEVGFIRRHINEDALRYSSSHLIREGNILLVTRTGVGKLAIAPFDVAISQDITGIILDLSQYCTEFFYYYLQVLVEDFKKMNQGTSINGIIRSDLEATLILKPSLDEQKQIAAVLNALDENLKNEQSNLNKYRDLKRGLMADLLTGKVRIK